MIFINEDLKITNMNDNQKDKNNKFKNSSNDFSKNNINKKLSSSNIIINNIIKKRKSSNINTNKNSTSNFFNNTKNLNSNNFNYISTNTNINNSGKLTIKNIINIINNSNCEKKGLKPNNNLTLGRNLTNRSENNFTKKIKNTKNKSGNSFLANYIQQKNLLNYVSNNASSNHLKRQSHQRNFSHALRHLLTNFKTEVTNKSNTNSISKKKELYGNESLISNPYFPIEKSIIANKYIKQTKAGELGNNKSHFKNKVI